jgi:hypothetical protein
LNDRRKMSPWRKVQQLNYLFQIQQNDLLKVKFQNGINSARMSQENEVMSGRSKSLSKNTRPLQGNLYDEWTHGLKQFTDIHPMFEKPNNPFLNNKARAKTPNNVQKLSQCKNSPDQEVTQNEKEGKDEKVTTNNVKRRNLRL